MKTITFELSPDSVEDAIRELERYSNSLMGKLDLFVERLGEIGIKVINANSTVPGDSTAPQPVARVASLSEDSARIDIIFEGKDVLFIEFGAGIHYNGSVGGSPHPLGSQFGYTIGSYGKGQGANDSWYYKGENGGRFKSYGTQAGMPVYKAAQQLRQDLTSIAKDVFG